MPRNKRDCHRQLSNSFGNRRTVVVAMRRLEEFLKSLSLDDLDPSLVVDAGMLTYDIVNECPSKGQLLRKQLHECRCRLLRRLDGGESKPVSDPAATSNSKSAFAASSHVVPSPSEVEPRT